jgi:hypothetical protein
VASPGEIDDFHRDGFVAVRGAFGPDVAAGCRAAVATALTGEGVDVDDPTTWTRPVVRVVAPDLPMVTAARSPLLADACDRLLGAGTWQPPLGVVGSVVVRFPHADDPGDAGWHVDGSYVGPDGAYWLNAASRGRALLALFLLTDVGPDDAPTELLVGSHDDVRTVLEPHGDAGASFLTVVQSLRSSTFERPIAAATGTAGDVFLCHPFLVHRATWPHRGTSPRMISQPAVTPA